jgi:hypothetical protein
MLKTRILKIVPLACALAQTCAPMAQAKSCRAEIEQLQTRLEKSRANVIAVLPQSTSATMHRQPTQASVAKAKGEAESKAEALLEQARKLEAQGKDAECLKVLEPVILP